MTENGAEFKTSGSSSSAEKVESIRVAEQMQSGSILEIGDSNARMSMQLFINHASTYSQQFHQMLLPRLIEDFVAKKNLRITIIPVAFDIYPQSSLSASLLLCATKQHKGQAMNDLLFSQPNTATLQKQIGEVGLSPKDLETCLKDPNLQHEINVQTQIGIEQKITAVPAYSIEGTLYTGLPEYADLRGQVEEALTR